MDERMRFVIRLKDGESMASLCRELDWWARRDSNPGPPACEEWERFLRGALLPTRVF